MMDQELAQLLMATFLDELHEHVGVLGRELLSQEKPLPPQELEQSWCVVSRSVHTLKGSSAIVNVDPIRDVCHYLEDIFSFHQLQQTSMSEDLTSFVLRVVDAIEEFAARLRAEDDLENATLIGLTPELIQLAEQFTSDPDQSVSPTEQAQPPEHASSPTASPETVAPTKTDDSSTAEAHVIEASDEVDQQEQGVSEQVEPDLSDVDPRLLALFVDELDEHTQTMSRNILALENTEESDASQQLLNELFRAAHSLKGAAGAVQIEILGEVCHRLEDLLSDIRDKKMELNSDTVSRVLEASDAIGDVGKRLRSGSSFGGSPIYRMKAKLDELFSDRPASDPSDEILINKLPENKLPESEKSTPAVASTQPTEARVPPKTTPKPKTESRPAAVAPQKESKPAPKPSKSVPPRPANPPSVDTSASIRVAAQKLDALLAHSGELLVARGRFAQRAKEAHDLRELATELRAQFDELVAAAESSESNHRPRRRTAVRRPARAEDPTVALKYFSKKIDALATGMEADNRLLSQTCSLLDDEIYHVRMLPFADACVGLNRAVRDIATTTHKQVTLQIDGADVEVDRSVLEGLKDPLLHLVRNSVDHGIEKPADRVAAGKKAEATVTVSASLRGGQVEVVVEDDGSGFDLKRICAMAAKRGLDVPDDPREQARLVFAPGFSTAKMITDISGRGVGLDVVQNRVESLHGAVEVSFVKGQGTRFTLMVPLTLTTIRSMLVVVSDQVYAIPTTSIERLVRFGADDVVSSVGRDTLLLREAPTPLVPLATPLGLKSRGLIAGSTTKGVALVLTAGDQRVAVSVDDVLSEQEVLVKNLGSRIRRLRHFSGCTLLPNGRIALVTNSANVVRAALGSTAPHSGVATRQSKKWDQKQLLLVDDSVTTRALLKNILETAGYDVVVAGDGQQAWELAMEADYDVIVSDVDMPRMNGFELTKKLRDEPRTAETPIVLVTARGSDGDKEQGVMAGANAYIVKGNFDQQNLLNTIAQLA